MGSGLGQQQQLSFFLLLQPRTEPRKLSKQVADCVAGNQAVTVRDILCPHAGSQKERVRERENER